MSFKRHTREDINGHLDRTITHMSDDCCCAHPPTNQCCTQSQNVTHNPANLDYCEHYNSATATSIAIANTNNNANGSKEPPLYSSVICHSPHYTTEPAPHYPQPYKPENWFVELLKFILRLSLVLLAIGAVIWGVWLLWPPQPVQPVQVLPSVDDFTSSRVEIAEGGPCSRMVQGRCFEAEDARSAIQWARHYLELGDADSALEDWDSARENYLQAITLGSGVGAQSAILAATRIQFQAMPCEYTDDTLARISRDYAYNPLGESIKMKQKKQALKALGHYAGPIDNHHSVDTRVAIRNFQDTLWFAQKDALSAEQTVLLVCGAAHIAKDVNSQNVLGVMYASGLGVKQNTDFALDWLEKAAHRKSADANWNLAMLYGTQTVLSSVQVCDAVENAERADNYLYEAAQGNHPIAKTLIHEYTHLSPKERWRKLRGDLNTPEVLNRVGRGCNPNS